METGHNHIGKHNKHIILMLICCLILIKDIVDTGNAEKGGIEM